MSTIDVVRKAVSRRGFLRAAPAAAAAAPLAARQIAAQSGGIAGPAGMPIGYANGPVPHGGIDPWQLAHKEMMKAVTSGKIPDWKMDELRLHARHRARWLDADLLTMRSISDSSRYRMQEDREVQHQIQEAIDNEKRNTLWDALVKKFTPANLFGSNVA